MASPVFGYPEGFSADIAIGPAIPGTTEEYELNFARRALRKLKDRLGTEAIEQLLQPDIDEGNAYWTDIVARNAPGDYNPCYIQLTVKGITADEFTKWFHTRCAKIVPAMQAAEPEHWVITSDDNGNQLVIENLGSTISKFDIEFEPPNQPFQQADLMEDFPLKLSGKTKLKNGASHAYVLHQFRPHTTGIGFDANLRAYFPKAAGDDILEQHRQHLVVEFTNWTRHCFKELKVDGVRL